MSESDLPSKNSAFGFLRTALFTSAALVVGFLTGTELTEKAPLPPNGTTNAPALYTYFVGAYADGAFVQYVPAGPPFTMVCPSNSFSIVYDGKALHGLKSIQVVVTTNVIPVQTNAPATPR